MGRRNRRQAFTLVELLVVVGIIVILIGILLPVLARSRDRATTLECANNLRQIMLAMTLYEADFRLFPYCQDPGYGPNNQMKPWVDVLVDRGYLAGPHLPSGYLGPLKCPATEEFRRPPTTIGYYPDYGYNYMVNPERMFSRSPWLGEQAFWGKRSLMTKKPEEKILLTETWSTEGRSDANGQSFTWRGPGGWFLVSGSDETNSGVHVIIERRHRDGMGVNIVYLDGHIQTVIYPPPTTLEPPEGSPFHFSHWVREP